MKKTTKQSKKTSAAKRRWFVRGFAALGVVLCILGLIGLASIIYYNQRGSALSPSTAPTIVAVPAKPAATSGYPVALSIPSLSKNLQVAEGHYNPETGAWSLSRDKAHFAVMTVMPNNESGNTLIYGHYRPEVFASLRKVQPGAEAIIQTDNGYRFVYTFQKSEKVAPNDTSILAYTGEPQLTLQTCTGIWMENRHLFTFKFERFEKI